MSGPSATGVWFWLAGGSAFAGVALLAWLGARAARKAGHRYRNRFDREVAEHLARAFVFVDPVRLRLLHGGAVLALVALVLVMTGQPAMAAVIALAAGAGPRLWLARLRRRRLAAVRRQLPDAIRLVAGTLRAGASLPRALAEAARATPSPLGQELALAQREQALGRTLGESLRALQTRLPCEEVQLLVAALAIAQRTGGELAAVLDTLADTLRRKAMLEDKIGALTAQGRLQARVMTALPPLLLFVLEGIDPVAMAPLYETGYGRATLVVVAAMLVVGGFWLSRIVAIRV